jgi:hypothetical protein
MLELSVVHIEQISRKEEIKYFQIPLPGTTKKIIAVEASCVLFTQVVPIIQEPITNPTPPVNNTTNNCPNPGIASIEAISDTIANNIRTQVFKIGAAVNPGFNYQCGVYSVTISVDAVDGDTPSTIAASLANAVNNTSLAIWNQFGSNNQNYKPTAIAVGDQITLTTDNQHSFFAAGTGQCFPAPPPDPLAQYDLLFFVSNNEKAGVLSLQSPDATDIFYQGEIFREDKNIGYGDFTMNGELAVEWLRGRKRFATEILIETASPILEAYYKDMLGLWYDKDLSYQINIFIWYEKSINNDK